MKPASASPVLRLAGSALFLGFALSWVAAAPAPERHPDLNVEWPMLGGTIHRNLANPQVKGLPMTWSVEKGKQENVKWSAALGTITYGGPVVSGGRVFVGTNNDKPRDPAVTGDKGILMCFDAATGKFLWQAVHDKLPEPDLNDTPKHGVASSPAVEGDRLYYVSNRCEVICANVADGKPFWKLDLVGEEKVFPCYLAICSPLVLGDLVYVVTANGVDPNTRKLPEPKSPSFVAVEKKTGKVAWRSNLPGEKIMEGQWGNAVAANVKGVNQVIFPGGDGWLYAFNAEKGELIWKFDCNPKAAVYKPGGKGDRSYLVATPVVYEDRLYVGVGNDPEDGAGVGHLWCVDITKVPANADKDLSPVGDNFDPKAPANKDSGLVWHYGGPVVPKPADGREVVFGRTISTVAIHDGLVYAAELEGYLHCIDAKTGQKYWDADLKDGIWNSPYYVDGRVLLGTDGGDLYVFMAGKEKNEPAKINMEQSVKIPPVAAGGVLYVTNGTTLYAIAAK
jgi:outer membrane protein assembly factor BamB